LKNVNGFLENDIILEGVAKYISELPLYKKLKKKIKFLRDRIKRTSNEKIKFFLRDRLRQSIEEKKKLIAVTFYEKHGHKGYVAIMAVKKARQQAKKFRSRNIGKRNKSLLRFR